MTPRRLLAAPAVVAALLLAACAPEPDPEPEPTGFATEEEAFAAAEETYRAYVEAANARNSGDPDVDPQEFLIGDPLEQDIKVRSILEETKQVFKGNFAMKGFRGVAKQDIDGATDVFAIVCMDSSDVLVLDAEGNNVTSEDIETSYALAVSFTTTSDGLKIHSSEATDETC